MIEQVAKIVTDAVEKGAELLDKTKEVATVEIPEILDGVDIEEVSGNLSSIITDIAQSTSEYFGLDNFSIVEGESIGFVPENEIADQNTVFNYNINLLKEMNCTSAEDITKVCTQKCANRTLESKFQDDLTRELGSDYLTGVRSQMLGLKTGNFEQTLAQLTTGDTNPIGQLKLRAMEFGRNVYSDLQNVGVKPTLERCLEEFNQSPFSQVSIENTGQGDNPSVKFSAQPTFTGMRPQHLAYGLHKLSEMPAVQQYIDDCKSSISSFLTNIGEKIDSFFSDMYSDIKSFFTLQEKDAKAIEELGESFVEQREFGLDKCTEAAKEIFNPSVIENWSELSLSQRKEIAGTYAAEVANAFELKNYTGVYFEDLEPGVMGYNNGNGSIHLSNDIIAARTSPLEIMNTITHELRHQYQFEAVQGLHNVAEDVVKEWSTAQQIYNYDQPYCYDPWGYTYNPLEIDARYAGETVVRNVTHDIFNS